MHPMIRRRGNSRPKSIPAAKAVRTPGALVIEIEDVTKVYEMGSETIHALRGVSA